MIQGHTGKIMSALLLISGLSNGQTQGKPAISSTRSTSIQSELQPIQSNLNYTKHKEDLMSDEQKNKAIVQRLFEEVLNNQNLAILPEIISEEYTGPDGGNGPASFGKISADLHHAIPDIHYQVLDILGEGNKVAARWKWQGTQTGPFRQFPASGKMITNEGQAIFEFRDGKIIGSATQTDRLGFLQTIGVIPTALAGPSNSHNGAVFFIDKFLIPATAKAEFYERMNHNRSVIKKLPGFIRDDVYEHSDNNGNLVLITVAQWANREAIEHARGVVQEEYQKEGFDMPAMMKRLNITMDRGLYTESAGH